MNAEAEKAVYIMSNQHFFICILCTIWECNNSNKKERTKAWFSSLASTNQQYRQTCTRSQDQPKRRLKKSLKTFISLGIHHYNISSLVIWLHFMQWSNGWKFVQFTVLQMLCNFERLKFVLVRDNIVRRHRPFNPLLQVNPILGWKGRMLLWVTRITDTKVNLHT